MQKTTTNFLRLVVILVGLGTLFLMIRMPLYEGRTANLDLFSIYTDGLILYVYFSSVFFFTALYKAFRLLGYAGEKNLYSLPSLKVVKSIKICAIILSILIVLAGVYIRFFHSPEDDPAGFIALCIFTTFISLLVALVAAKFEKILRKRIESHAE